METTHKLLTNEERNAELAFSCVQALEQVGVRSASLAMGVRSLSLVVAMEELSSFPLFSWNDERSAAFFALGESRKYQAPVAVVTTSGTAAGELLPAVMEAYYSCTPLILITTDRPRRFRGSGAPQCAEQIALFGCYTPLSYDIAYGESISLTDWNRQEPVHLNICFEEGYNYSFHSFPDTTPEVTPPPAVSLKAGSELQLTRFLEASEYPLVVVGHLKEGEGAAVTEFLLESGIPAYIEAASGIREKAVLQKQRLFCSENLFKRGLSSGYPVDAVLRIGGVPTIRFWRDLEERQVSVLSVTAEPFSGLSWAPHISHPIGEILKSVKVVKQAAFPHSFFESDRKAFMALQQALAKEPSSEPALIAKLSRQLPEDALVYLGNSLPIREWDQVADSKENRRRIFASRGLNGIDGQISTFYGLCSGGVSAFALLGDMTTLYDLGAPWILPQLPEDLSTSIVVINNGGGRIFDRLSAHATLQNCHNYSFEAMAKMWGMEYLLWKEIPDVIDSRASHRLIELCPDHEATRRFWKVLRET